jgi:hypothetical protein
MAATVAVIGLCLWLKPAPVAQATNLQETKSIGSAHTTVARRTNNPEASVEMIEKATNAIVRDKGATFSVVASSKSSPAPVAPENPHLNK